MDERKDKYKYFDLKFDSAKEFFIFYFLKKLFWYKILYNQKSNNSSPPFALILS